MVGTKYLSLEISEYCNLDCKHCMQGEKKNIYISDEVISNTFRNINKIEELVLTGGEVFLCYERVKRVLEIACEENSSILNCSIVTNGCIYDERIYALLDDYFGSYYAIYISNDDYHDKSIARVYQGKKNSDNPELHPQTLEDVKRNMLKHMMRDSFEDFNELGSKVIDVGRARQIAGSKHCFEVMGYFYQEFPNHFLVGPVVFVSATGEVCEGNDEITSYKKHSIGNILNENLITMVKRGGIKKQFGIAEEFFQFLGERIEAYDTLKGPHYHIIDGKMVEVEFVRDNASEEEMERFIKFLLEEPLSKDKILSYDFSRYPYDVSLVEHME